MDFDFRSRDYHIKIVGAEVFPQGFAAIADKLSEFSGAHMLCDIVNGTMNILRLSNRKPDPRNMFTEKYGVNQCVLAMREALLREHGYDPRLMKLYAVGGSGCLIKNFCQFDRSRVTICDDICATAKGYEYMAEVQLRKGGK